MKKILFLFLILLLFTGCKKEMPQIQQQDNYVHLSFVTSNNSKTNIQPNGVVGWSSTDVLHVYSKNLNKCLGTLTNTNVKGNTATFEGDILAWSDDDLVSFYYYGNNTPDSDGKITINYSDQSNDGTLESIAGKYHVSCLRLTLDAPEPNMRITGQLLNKMSIGYFTMPFESSIPVKLYAENGLYNSITVESDGELTYGVVGINPNIDRMSGQIMLNKNLQNVYVALLPSIDTDADMTLYFTTNNEQYYYNVESINENDYYTGSSYTPLQLQRDNPISADYIDFTFVESNNGVSLFSVGENKQVKFTAGNLVYDQGRCKQHINQWSRCFKKHYSSNYGVKKFNVAGTFDIFAWATSGYNHGNLLYMPYTISQRDPSPYNQASIGYGFGPAESGNYAIDLYDSNNVPTNADWGEYRFGMKSDNLNLRTLRYDEWEYLLDIRTVNINGVNTCMWGLGNIVDTDGETVNDLIILPDNWNPSNHPDFVYGYSNYVNTLDDLLDDGVVFLPVAGARNGGTVTDCYEHGRYYSSSRNTNKNYKTSRAHYIYFRTDLLISVGTDRERYNGYNVRLVSDN